MDDLGNRTNVNLRDDNDIAEFAYDALGRRIQLSGTDMKRNQLVLTFASVSLILSLLIGCQQSAVAQSAKNTAESPHKVNQAPEPSKVSLQSGPNAKNLSPRISFEKTVCDLGDVGQGTKNTCEFKFTNTGQALLKIGKIKRTCGCTVFELDRKEYAPGRKGTIRVSYTAGKATALRQKHIYVPSNDKDNPKVKLTIKARVVQLVEAAPQKLQLRVVVPTPPPTCQGVLDTRRRIYPYCPTVLIWACPAEIQPL